MSIAAILKHKGNDVASVTASATIVDITTILSNRRIGAVLVLDSGALKGIVSERDIVHCLAHHGAAALDMTASQVMTRHVQTAARTTTVEEAMAMMTAGRFRHLPVMDGDHLAGIVSIGDVVKVRIETQAHEVDSLKAYVSGAA